MIKILRNISQILTEILQGLAGLVKGHIILMLVTFLLLSIGFLIIDIPLPFLIALGITIFDILPVLGSGMIMIPWAIISLISGNTYQAAGVAIIYLLVSISRQILEPIIVGHKIGVRPIYTFLSSIIGSIIFGPIGFLVGPLLAILLTSVYKIRNKNPNIK